MIFGEKKEKAIIDIDKVDPSDNESAEKKNNSNKIFEYSVEERKVLKKINIATVPFICAILFIQVC